VFPELPGDFDWVDTCGAPPCSLVARAMNRAVVDSAERHREFVARLAAERARLYVPKMMGVRRL
jgi:hypothetical protein